MRASLALLAFASPLVVGCTPSDNTISRVYPDLTLVPEAVDFGGVAVLFDGTENVTIVNAGLAALTLSDVRVESETPRIFSVDDPSPVSLAKDEELVIPITFSPDTYLTYAGSLVVESDDPERPQIVVPLTGEGIYAPTPDIDVDPLSWDFGNVDPPFVSLATVTVANKGGATLTLGEVSLAGSAAFSLVGADPSGYAIAADQSLLLVYSYAPTTTDGDSAEILIASDDPDEPELTVTLLGNGGGDYEYPTAVIDCPDSIVPRERVTLDGSDSSDPNGLELTYAWSLAGRPSGSAVEGLESDTKAYAMLTPDIAGDYAVSLTVTNSVGISSAAATCTTPAIPEEELHVELSWDGSAADVDLHLLEPGGEFFRVPGDCNFCNQGDDWGVVLDTTDDPTLDIDDTSGYGPENTNIDVPAEGEYRILVHYFTSNGDGDVVATVRVYSYGLLAFEDSIVMESDHIWAPGIIDWATDADFNGEPDGAVIPVDDYYNNVMFDENGEPYDGNDGDTDPDQGPRECFY